MKLIFHLGNGKVETFSVKKNSVSIGRGTTCDVVLPYEGFSRQHAQIDVIDGEIYVTDLGSTNGVFIEGQRIPASTKTLTQSFFNLQIGPAQQVEIMDDEHRPVATSGAVIPNPKREVKLQRADQTKTTQMDSAQLKRTTKKKVAAKSNKPAIILLLIFLVAAAAYYFMTTEEEVAPVTEVVTEVAAPVVPVLETEFLSQNIIDSLYKDRSCAADKASWCELARLVETNFEGVVIEGKSLVVYLNMGSYKDEMHAEAFNRLDEKERLEILALRRVLNTNLLRDFVRQKNLDNVQVIAGAISDDQYRAFAAFKFKLDLNLQKIEKFSLYNLFESVLNEGKLDLMSDISDIYDKVRLQ